MSDDETNVDSMVELFKSRKISCKDLEKKEGRRWELAKEARRDGMNKIGEADESIAKKLREVRQRLCKLK